MSFALLGGVCLRGVYLQGAEVWTKDPATWDEKDIAKLLSDSPWAQKVQVSPGGGGMGGPGGGMGGAGGGMGGGDDPTGQLSGPGGGGGGGMGGGGGGMGGGGGRRGGGGMGGGGGMQPMTFTVRWMSSLPLKQAIVRSRMGKEADTSPQAKEFLERQESHYAVALIGPPRGGGAGGGAGAVPGGAQQDRMQRMTEHLKETTGLLRKGKEPIRPETVQTPQPGQNSYLFLFPRADAITLDDKEVEFATRMGPLEVKRKFKLKDMVYNGQLAL
ncbi:MAG: hypothetical protein ABI972_30595 [Acidobacteriota bacterium]